MAEKIEVFVREVRNVPISEGHFAIFLIDRALKRGNDIVSRMRLSVYEGR
jgi:hypothetical protein